jgi:hypothetical protein
VIIQIWINSPKTSPNSRIQQKENEMIFMISTGVLTLLALLGLNDSDNSPKSIGRSSQTQGKSNVKNWRMDPSSFEMDGMK